MNRGQILTVCLSALVAFIVVACGASQSSRGAVHFGGDRGYGTGYDDGRIQKIDTKQWGGPDVMWCSVHYRGGQTSESCLWASQANK